MRSISSPASARAKNWARGWAEATHSECREAPPARRKGSTLLSDSRAPRLKECAKIPSPARLKRDFTRFAVSKIEMKSQRATANAAERQRSRSEADTGRRIGASFGLEFRARASSAIPEGIAVLGEGDALAARGGRAEDEPERKVRCSCDPLGAPALSPRRGAPRGGMGDRPKPMDWGDEGGVALATHRVAQAGRLPTGGPQHAAPRRELLFLLGVLPAKVKQK